MGAYRNYSRHALGLPLPAAAVEQSVVLERFAPPGSSSGRRRTYREVLLAEERRRYEERKRAVIAIREARAVLDGGMP